jgi:hypothetical protein
MHHAMTVGAAARADLQMAGSRRRLPCDPRHWQLSAVSSRSFVGGQLAHSGTTLSFHQPLRGLRCDAEVFVLMEDQ